MVMKFGILDMILMIDSMLVALSDYEDDYMLSKSFDLGGDGK
jgi:hypothetical protein